MVTFEDLPFEIRSMIIEEAVPDISTQRWKFPASDSKSREGFSQNGIEHRHDISPILGDCFAHVRSV